jgi:hypothetical protein
VFVNLNSLFCPPCAFARRVNTRIAQDLFTMQRNVSTLQSVFVATLELVGQLERALPVLTEAQQATE